MATRRTYLPPQERGLLLMDSLWDHNRRRAQFAHDLHIDPQDTITTATTALVMPDWQRRNGKRWPGINPAMMWHPLLWLDDDLVTRLELPIDGAQETYTEEDESLAVRIALVCMTSGLYDPLEATWLDALSTINIDIDDPRQLERVRRWNDGAPDPDLDALQLTPITKTQGAINAMGVDVAPAVEDAGVLLATLQAGQAVQELLDPAITHNEVSLRALLATIATLTLTVLPRRLTGPLGDLAERLLDPATSVLPTAEQLLATLQDIAAEHTRGADLYEDMFTTPA